ncbi:hypothetical protein EVAR_433_1 [Eumeta japonica]|uniref:Uncharacterized protein n=1 Tax=Eumeta variegata TaxID=151549 RepID=A0A4C1SD23_EUMVA|nr:hypothetical protein EVAR_433_1 [Eumeta japonica]
MSIQSSVDIEAITSSTCTAPVARPQVTLVSARAGAARRLIYPYVRRVRRCPADVLPYIEELESKAPTLAQLESVVGYAKQGTCNIRKKAVLGAAIP